MKAASRSDRGKWRTNNEDSLLTDPEKGIFLLADGMGGHQAGEVASKIAVREAYVHLVQGLSQVEEDSDLAMLLTQAVFKAHDAVRNEAKSDLALMGMGTTLVEVVIRGGKAHICHVGDSRAYLLRDTLQQLTRDQTLGESLVDHHLMQREQVPPQTWHVLTQAVGIDDQLVPECLHLTLEPGDIMLLCSDGLTDMLSNGQIGSLLKRYANDPERAADNLVQAANDQGGQDNISVVTVKYV